MRMKNNVERPEEQFDSGSNVVNSLQCDARYLEVDGVVKKDFRCGPCVDDGWS